MNEYKVLHILASLRSGGVAALLYNLYLHIDKEKIKFDFIVHVNDVGFFEKKFEKLGCKIYHLPRFKKIFTNFILTRRIIKTGNYKIVHVHHTDKSFLQLIAAWSCGVKVRIAHSHDCIKSKSLINILKYPVFNTLTNIFSTDRMACSIDASNWVFGEKALLSGKAIVLKNGIDIGKFKFSNNIREKVRRNNSWQDKYVIGHIGRFADQKNHIKLIDIFYEVWKKQNNSILVLIGEGELVDIIKEKVFRLGMQNDVYFIGSTDSVSDYLQAMDVFVLPSKHEGLGIVLIEAQAAGLPCVASDVVPVEAKVTDLVTFLSLDDSPEEWAHVILEKMNMPRYDRTKEIEAAGYNILKSSSYLENFYIKALKG